MELIKHLANLHLSDKLAVQLEKTEPDYVLDLAVQNSADDPLIGAACSDFTIRLMSRERLAHVSTLTGHKDTVTKIQFGKTESPMVYSCSKDKTVRCWDIRVSTSKEVHMFQAPPATKADFLSLDVSCSDKLLCAGTEKVDNDAYLLFWDTRQNSLLGGYSECHQDDVTQVCFQPASDQYLISGSADGLVCMFDLAETSEDEALMVTMNAESDVAKVGWCGQDLKECVYCVTSDNSFHIWDALEGDVCCTINSLSSSQEDNCGSYLVDCIPEFTANNDRSTALLLTGSYSGSLQLLSCTNQNSDGTNLCTLSGGHSATVRCCHWDSKTQTLLTGGEDSLVCIWSAKQSEQFLNKDKKLKVQGKLRSKSNVSEHPGKPYSKKKK